MSSGSASKLTNRMEQNEREIRQLIKMVETSLAHVIEALSKPENPRANLFADRKRGREREEEASRKSRPN